MLEEPNSERHYAKKMFKDQEEIKKTRKEKQVWCGGTCFDLSTQGRVRQSSVRMR